MSERRVATEPIELGTYYRRRCEPKKLRLSMYNALVRLDNSTVRWIEPEDPISDKEPARYKVRVLRRIKGMQCFRVHLVSADALLLVTRGDPGLREVF